MAIENTEGICKGENIYDLMEYTKLYTEKTGNPSNILIEPKCDCSNNHFYIEVIQGISAIKRRCSKCGQEAFIADSEKHWPNYRPETVKCSCNNKEFELVVAFSMRTSIFYKEVKWITVGQRCVKCGILGSSVGWKIDYSPSGHLLDKI